jgi:RecA/RadA recombinase
LVIDANVAVAACARPDGFRELGDESTAGLFCGRGPLDPPRPETNDLLLQPKQGEQALEILDMLVCSGQVVKA